MVCLLLLGGNPAGTALAAGGAAGGGKTVAAADTDPAKSVLGYKPALPDAKTTRLELREILSQPEYKDEKADNAEPGLLERFLDWLGRLLASLGLSGGTWVGTLVIIVVASLLIYLLLRMFSGLELRKLKLKDGGAQAEKQYTAGEMLAQAEDAARRGDFREAVRLRFRAFLRQIEMPASSVLTNTQLVRALALENPDTAAPLKQFVGCFEDAWYGGLPCGSIDYHEAARLADQVLAAVRREAA